jgi:hypothetical protein
MAKVETQTMQERFFLKAIELVVLREIAIGEIKLASDAGMCRQANELAKEMIGLFLVEKAENERQWSEDVEPVVKKIWDEMQKENANGV